MPKLASAVLAIAFAPALVALPTVTSPRDQPRPVPPRLVSLPLHGVDSAALAASLADRTAGWGLTGAATGAPGLPPAAARRPVVLTAPRSVERFGLAGVTWRASAIDQPVFVAVRVREHGRWTGWQQLHAPDEGPDLGSAEQRAIAGRAGTSPLLTDGADGVQVRVHTPTGRAPADLRLDLIDPGTSPADDDLGPAVPASSAVAALAQPTIITRAQWGADERLSSATDRNGTVRGIVIHHTASTNSYSQSSAVRQLRSIYAYHTKNLGYSDIAYNFLVDRFGRIYEGRKGSITSAVKAAHAGGFNVDTMGVSALGDYDVTAAPAAMVDAIVRVSAWKLSQYGRDPLGRVTLTSEGGGTSKYARGQRATVSVLAAHRDVGQTACPGKNLFALMGSIRARAAAAVKRFSPAPAPAPLPRPTPTPTPRPAPPPLDAKIISPRLSTQSVSYGSRTGVWVNAAFATRQTWQLRVTPLCASSSVRSFTGAAATRLSAAWDLRDAMGNYVSPGIYRLDLISASGAGRQVSWSTDVEVTPTLDAPAARCAAYRLAGPDRYATSVAAGRAAFPTGPTVVLAPAAQANLADGVVAAPLARAKRAPLLLVGGRALGTPAAQEITRRRATTAFVVGSTQVIGTAVEAQLRSLGVRTVVRLAGRDRFETAAAVARAVGGRSGRAVVTSGFSLIDAAVVSGAAARTGRPILLVGGPRGSTVAAAALRALRVRAVDVVGGAGAVSPRLVAGLGVGAVTRYGGKTRWDTAAVVARGFAPAIGPSKIMVASGSDASMLDSVAGGVLGLPTVLTGAQFLPAASAEALRPATSAVVVGGPQAVSTATLRSIAEAVAR